jgi:hypothetical protein
LGEEWCELELTDDGVEFGLERSSIVFFDCIKKRLHVFGGRCRIGKRLFVAYDQLPEMVIMFYERIFNKGFIRNRNCLARIPDRCP